MTAAAQLSFLAEVARWPGVARIRPAEHESWWKDAACFGLDVALFFPPMQTKDAIAYAEARRVCASCPVRAECLKEAMSWERPGKGQRYGMRGGLSPMQRDRYARLPIELKSRFVRERVGS